MKNNNPQIQFLTVLMAMLFLASCASMSSMQTARVTDKGEVGFGGGAGYVRSDINLGDSDTISIAAPFLEAFARYGITERLDMGVKFTVIGPMGIDAKYQFYGDKESGLAASAGFGLFYLPITSGDSKAIITDLHFPLYLSVHPLPALGIYAVPKFILRNNSYNADGVRETETSNWLGVTTGMRFGRKNGLFVEYSYFGNNKFDVPLSQFNIGFGIGIN